MLDKFTKGSDKVCWKITLENSSSGERTSYIMSDEDFYNGSHYDIIKHLNSDSIACSGEYLLLSIENLTLSEGTYYFKPSQKTEDKQ